LKKKHDQKEKKEDLILFWLAYAFFLSNNTTNKTRTMIINMNSPAATGIKYMSAAEAGDSVDTGVGVADASRTAI